VLISGKMAVLLATPLLLLGLLLSASYVVVEVKERGPQGHHFVIPVPLALAQAALALAPAEARELRCPQAARYLPVARRLLTELRRIPDAELVRVEQPGQMVRIRKAGDQLLIDVQDHGQEAHVALPLEAAQQMLASYSGEGFRSSRLVAALKTVSHTDLVHVRDGQDEVKVWIW
jgi:hypothetical protein